MIIYTLAKTKEELTEILVLQQKNYKDHLSEREMLDEGFLSLKHEFPELREISGNYHHVIAKENDKVIGYALVMLKQFKDKVPVLIPMFDQIDALQFNGKFLRATDYFVMGQICIDKNYRGMGVFDGLYQKLKEVMSGHFQITVTEVATRNLRSMKAHRRVGFKSMLDYVSPEKEEWALIFWDWE
jgi:predicted GNAT family N-acyltransferase